MPQSIILTLCNTKTKWYWCTYMETGTLTKLPKMEYIPRKVWKLFDTFCIRTPMMAIELLKRRFSTLSLEFLIKLFSRWKKLERQFSTIQENYFIIRKLAIDCVFHIITWSALQKHLVIVHAIFESKHTLLVETSYENMSYDFHRVPHRHMQNCNRGVKGTEQRFWAKVPPRKIINTCLLTRKLY